jgi:hypothetical protein
MITKYSLILLAAFAGGAYAENTVDVFVTHFERVPFPTVARAEAVASALFSTAQVRLVWHGSPPSDLRAEDRYIILTLETDYVRRRHSQALGYALPFEGVHASIFYDRIRLMDQPSLDAILLGYAMSHEMTHLLQGVMRHSETGVMKSSWDTADYFQMKRGQLRFEDDDIRTIQNAFRRSLAVVTRYRTLPAQ